jgi:signal transduction histidine kinase
MCLYGRCEPRRWAGCEMYYRRSKHASDSLVECGIKIDPNMEMPESPITLSALQSLIAAQERELSNIARELHDDICQRLAMLSLKIERVTKQWSAGEAQVGEQLENIWKQCNVLTHDVQALSHELHPSLLDNLGLIAAVRSICRELSEQSSVAVDFTTKNVPSLLPREVSLSLFRIVQEALHNALKHSRGTQFSVHMTGVDDGIRLEIRDWGVGFDTTRVRSKGGLGLVGMRERIQLLNGKIEIDSRPNAGTRVRVNVPLDVKFPLGAAKAN